MQKNEFLAGNEKEEGSRSRCLVQRRNLLYLFYTMLFCLCLFGVLIYFRMADRSRIYRGDGWRQHVKAMTYLSKWLRGYGYQMVHSHSFRPPLFAFGIGYGQDVLTTLHYYGFGDPLVLLSALVPSSYMDLWYASVMGIRAYLAGLFFLFFLQKVTDRKLHSLPALTGALIYVFSSQCFYIAMLHPFFMIPSVLLPLLLLGIHRQMREGRGGLLCATVFLALVSNFYFAFMLAICAALYLLLTWKKESLKNLPGLFLAGGKGIALSSFILLPVLLQFFRQPRVMQGMMFDALYPLSSYAEYLSDFITWKNHPVEDTMLGYAAVCAGLLPFVFGRESRVLRVAKRALLLCLLFLLFPFFGTAFNAFAYTTNRWTFAAGMVVAASCALVMNERLYGDRPQSEELTGGEALERNSLHGALEKKPSFGVSLTKRPLVGKILPAMIFVLYLAACFFTGQFPNQAFAFSVVLALLSFVVFQLSPVFSRRSSVAAALLLLCTVVSILGNSYFANAPAKGNFPSEFMERVPAGHFEEVLKDTELSAFRDLEGEGAFCRYSGRNLLWNAAILDGISSTQSMFSLSDAEVGNYLQSVGIPEQAAYAYFGVDDRMIASALAGVKYFTLAYDNDFEKQYVPYGFEDMGLRGSTTRQGQETAMKNPYHLYANPYALPFGYTYGSWIPEQTFRKLSLTMRQEAMLYGAVVDPDGQKILQKSGIREQAALETAGENVSLHQKEIPFQMTTSEGIQVEKENGQQVFRVQQAGESLTFTFDGLAQTETYLVVNALSVDGVGKTFWPTITSYGMIPAAEKDAKEGGRASDAAAKETAASRVTDANKKLDKQLVYIQPRGQNFSDWHNFAVNMGYDEAPRGAITFTFDQAGTWRVKDFAVVCMTPQSLREQVPRLLQTQLKQVDLHKNPISFATGKITGEIASPGEQILTFNLPYAEGWKLKIDGKKTDLFHVNVMFMGALLQEGAHQIELTYMTPGLYPGMLISIFALVLMILCRCLRMRTGAKDQRCAKNSGTF